MMRRQAGVQPSSATAAKIALHGTAIAGLVLAAKAGRAQTPSVAAPVVPAEAARTQAAQPPAMAKPAPTEPANILSPGEIEFTGRDGEPLPPDKQKTLRERFRNDPLLAGKTSTRTPSAPSAGAEAKDILVTGRRPRGSVIGDIPAAQTFNPLDIKAYGASDIGELIQSLGPQVSSNRGRTDAGPVVLLNGKRVSSYLEIAKIPTEAIERMEVFPEELALKYGYRADQKVVNIVTYEHFSSRLGRMSYARPTDGGRDTTAVGANYLRIAGNTRLNIDADYDRSGSLLESERGIRQLAGAPDLGRFRTLLPASERLVLTGTASAAVLTGVTSTLNGRFEANTSKSLLGLGVSGPLARNLDTHDAHLGTTQDGRVGKWLWSFTANYDRVATDTLTDTGIPDGARDQARSVNALVDASLVLSGSLLKLPAGPLSTSVQAGGEMRDFRSRSVRGTVAQQASLSRNRGAIQSNFDMPLTSRRGTILPGLGDLSANVNVAAETLSDYSTLWTLGYGLNWSPTGRVNIIASATNEQGAPTVEQLGAPLVVTPNARTFDFVRREVVDVTGVFGGNPDLRSDSRHVVKFGINAKPIANYDLTLSMDFIRTRIDDPIASFPITTPALESAFPERFTRNADGRLIRIDSRPLNFARSDQERIRWGINVVRPLGSVPPGMQNANARFVGSEADLQKALPPGARIIKPEPGSAAARQFESLSSRLTLNLYYTLTTIDRIATRQGGPVLDRLDGSATDIRGGTSRHKIEVQTGVFKHGLGARLTTTWQSGSVVHGVSQGANSLDGDLRFSSYAIVNFNLFANLADRFGGKSPPTWLKGARISLGLNNLLNTRQRVRDETGATPLSYQPAYLDPLGRVVNVSLRKLF